MCTDGTLSGKGKAVLPSTIATHFLSQSSQSPPFSPHLQSLQIRTHALSPPLTPPIQRHQCRHGNQLPRHPPLIAFSVSALACDWKTEVGSDGVGGVTSPSGSMLIHATWTPGGACPGRSPASLPLVVLGDRRQRRRRHADLEMRRGGLCLW